MSAIIIIGGYEIVRSLFNTRKSTEIKNVADDPKNEEKWTLGSSNEIGGTDYVYIPLESEKKDIDVKGIPFGPMAKSAMHSYGRYFNNSRNILFINKRNQKMNWLYPTNNQIIKNLKLISKEDEWNNHKNISTIIYEVINADTDNDNRLSVADNTNIYISSPDGTNNKLLFKSVDQTYGNYVVDNNLLTIMYQSYGRGYSSMIGLENNNIICTTELPKI
jgi:hypothetical protein